MAVRIFIMIAIVLFSGCASNPMVVSPNQQIQSVETDKSQVIFMRSSFVGSAINASLYEVTNGEIKYIGIIGNENKLSYVTTPGEHIFMVVSEAADFMEANLTPGKNYFSITTPRMGAWKARFSLWPIKNDPEAPYNTSMPEFEEWKSSTKLVQHSDASKAWYENNKESVQKKYNKYWPAWQQKSQEDIDKRTLAPEDGL